MWHDIIRRNREEILRECKRDPSPPGPAHLIRFIRGQAEPNDEGKEREDQRERESRERATSAAKARALGLDRPDLSDMDFAKRLIHYDDFYGSYSIKFDR